MGDERAPLVVKKKKLFKAQASPSWGLCLNPLAWLLWGLDFLVWLLSVIGPIKTIAYYLQGSYSVEIDTALRRKKKGELITTAVPGKEIRTIPELVDWMCEEFAEKPVMGTRSYEGEYKPPGAKFPLKKFGETTWMTYAELKVRALKFGAALVSEKFGMRPLPPGADLEVATGPHTLLLFEDTCAAWMTAALGASYYSIVVATSYATLGISAVADSVEECLVPVVLTNRKQVDTITKNITSRTLKAIIYTNLNVIPSEVPIPASRLMIEDMEDVIAGARVESIVPALPSPEMIALIMYTSGSTGKPKGVMLKHLSVCSSVGGLSEALGRVSVPGDCYLGYLPQAHILELCAELTCLRLGVKIGYADPRSISSAGAVRVRPDGTLNTTAGYPYPPGAIQEFRPAFMAGVPKIWDILKKAIEDQIGKSSALKQTIFQIAYAGRATALRQHREAPLLKALVFSKLKNLVGGNIKGSVSGGGAISSEVQTFVRTAFCAPALQGYALTETCCSATFQNPNDEGNVDGVVGPPLESVEIRLASVDIQDANGKPYLSTDTSHLGTRCKGRGEIQIRGPPVASGYFKQPDKTAEVFGADGWFRTGDVGVWAVDGQLKIVDRLKNLVKLKGGEYVAIEHMEKEYSTCHYVSGANGGVMCYGDHDLDRPVAFVVGDEKKISEWAAAAGIAVSSFSDLCRVPEVVAEVLSALQKSGKSGGLGTNEIIAGCVVLPGTGPHDNTPPRYDDPWTPENGMLTASNKLNRKAIIKEYGADGVFDALKAKGIK
ncbi:hypothetical protein CTAYLR_008406 [Chrysophaeum taylorii]|uniref:AMP-dependent synthetase/ligase domain-containing protein n=1 Tax=Chrysophaeum taylorii TaxID=2483200 RepID=A0AAD7UJK8_9STRA|nr:hypothetical protein CTAYLR_008406 [Chrysophaeum taylorii]